MKAIVMHATSRNHLPPNTKRRKAHEHLKTMHKSTYMIWIVGTLLTILPYASAIDYEFCAGHKEKYCGWWWMDQFAVFQDSRGEWPVEVSRAWYIKCVFARDYERLTAWLTDWFKSLTVSTLRRIFSIARKRVMHRMNSLVNIRTCATCWKS